MNKILEFIKKNYILSLSLFIFFILFIVMSVFWVKKGTFSLEEGPVILDCDVRSTSDHTEFYEETTCSVYVNPEDVTIVSINANYDLPEEMTYMSFTNDNENLTELSSTSEGFSISSETGITERTLIGTFKTKIGFKNVDKQYYDVGLKEITLTNSEEEIINVDPVSATVRIKNRIVSLENITMVEDTISESFDPDLKSLRYDARVASNVDKINIVATPTDENASLLGDAIASDLQIHYGTNEFDINVRAENGVTFRTYWVSIYREYNFNTTIYKYNEEQNYIYTVKDTGDTIKNKLESLPTGLNYSIEDNKLKIKYEEEVIQSINILNFELDYQIDKGKIYVGNGVTVEEFLTKLNNPLDTISFKLYNGSGTLINISKNDDGVYVASNHAEDIIDNNYSLEVIYHENDNNSKLDTLSTVTDYYNFNNLIVDDNKNIIKRIPIGMTYGELRSKIDTNSTITFISNDNSVIIDNEATIKTGDKVRIAIANEPVEYSLSVVGLLNNDNQANFADVIILYRAFRGKTTLTNEYLSSADINNDGAIGFDDVILLYRYFRGRINTLEVVE